MIEIDATVPSELVPLSWLIGVWEGTGVVSYPVDGELREFEFGQRVSFSHDGTNHLNYSASSWLLGDDSDAAPQPLTAETGYWRLSRTLTPGDPGPGMLTGTGPAPFTTADEVETLRNADGGFDLEVSIIHPGGVSELYLGQVKGPRIDLGTDAVMRSANAREHSASTRLYGLVDNHLLWAWDIAALGQQLASHASGRLARVE
jgi:hypothetical protein